MQQTEPTKFQFGQLDPPQSQQTSSNKQGSHRSEGIHAMMIDKLAVRVPYLAKELGSWAIEQQSCQQVNRLA